MPKQKAEVTQAILALQAGGVIGHEAEGVWGLACDPNNKKAVDRLLELKSRPAHKGLILIGATFKDFAPWLGHLPEQHVVNIRQSWPGAVTWILPDPNGLCPEWIRGRVPTLAARVPARTTLRALCAAFGGPLVSTSANVSGKPPARTQAQVQAAFGDQLNYLMPPSQAHLSGKTSTIVNALTLEVLRP